MERVVSADEMRWCDDTAIRLYGIAGSLLMENAGRGIAEIIKRRFSPLEAKHALVFCGKGNNGGDGFVAARLLAAAGMRVTCILLASAKELKGDAKVNLDILKQVKKKMPEAVAIKPYSANVLHSIDPVDVIVDAIFGTGFAGTVKNPVSTAIEWINKQAAPVLAVDIPSGVNGTTGVRENLAVKARLTATFGSLKSGLLCNQGRELAGEEIVVDIGIPKKILADERLKTWRIEIADVKRNLPVRSVHVHKYSIGKVFVLAGSRGLTGAAAMSSVSALRAGAGAVVLGTPDSVYPILAKKLTEVMVAPLPATGEGSLSLQALGQIQEKLSWADVAVIGPGLSQHRETRELIMEIVRRYSKKILLDADGLNALAAAGIDRAKDFKAQAVLTPHVGEFSRLTGIPPKEVEHRRIEAARMLARKTRFTIVLKGVPTVTADAGGNAFLNSTGNPGMATAGAGDVLSGIIAGLWAQGMNAPDAASAGVYLHGLAGDLAAKKLGERSLVANDLIDFLPSAFDAVETAGVE
jgi:hydroxyethylthiazole kinase-like uncharacterized protein yjeF